MRSLVGEARKRSWSFFDSILRLGLINLIVSNAGGEGNGGVSGAGVAGASCCREARRGVRRGSLFESSVFGCGAAGSVGDIADGMLMVCQRSFVGADRKIVVV